MRGADIVVRCLEHEGVEVVFGYPGGAILPAYDAMLDYPIRHILVRHEQGATHMADGYARATGKVGVAVATSGPGATNMITGAALATINRLPVLLLPSDYYATRFQGQVLQDIEHRFERAALEHAQNQ